MKILLKDKRTKEMEDHIKLIRKENSG